MGCGTLIRYPVKKRAQFAAVHRSEIRSMHPFNRGAKLADLSKTQFPDSRGYFFSVRVRRFMQFPQ